MLAYSPSPPPAPPHPSASPSPPPSASRLHATALASRPSRPAFCTTYAPLPSPPHSIVTANVVLLIAFDVDLPAIFATADELGMLDAPYAWFAPDSFFASDLGAMLAAGQRLWEPILPRTFSEPS